MREALGTFAGVYLISFVVAGCATLDPVDTSSAASIRAGIEVEDRVVLTTLDAGRHELRIAELTDREIIGTDEDRETSAIPYTDIASLHLRRSRPGRTAGVVVGVATVVAFVAEYPAVALAGILIGLNDHP